MSANQVVSSAPPHSLFLKSNRPGEVMKGAWDQFPHQDKGVRYLIGVANAKGGRGVKPAALVKIWITHQNDRLMAVGSGPAAGLLDQRRAEALIPMGPDNRHRT